MSAGAYTSVPDVIDYLVAGIRALPQCALPVVVADGWPGVNQPQQLVVVAGGESGNSAAQLRSWAVMGQGPSFREELYQVPILIRCWGGGVTVKPYRDQAFVLFKAIEAFVIADMNLGGAISRHYPAEISAEDLQQTEASGSNKGRVAEIRGAVSVRHRY